MYLFRLDTKLATDDCHRQRTSKPDLKHEPGTVKLRSVNVALGREHNAPLGRGDSGLDALCASTTRNSATKGFVPIPVEQPRDGMCLKLGGGRPSPEGRWRPHRDSNRRWLSVPITREVVIARRAA
jgi:hypothetical protein